MKAWDWINMRKSLGDAFEETTIKNMPIDQFWSFKLRNRVQNWNLHEKLSKICLFRNFNFWSKINAKSQSQLVQGQSQRIHGPGRFRVSGRFTDRTTKMLTSYSDVSMTWTCLRGCWRGVMTSSCDVDDISSSFRTWQESAIVTSVWRRSQNLGRHVEMRVRSDEDWNLRFCRSVDKEVVRAASVIRRRCGN